MEKTLNLLKDKRAQYVVIVWILLIKVVEIAMELLANIEMLSFFETLGFSHLSALFRIVWDMLVTLTVVWLIYRLAKDTFHITLKIRKVSKWDILSAVLPLIWAISSVTAILQLAQIASLPSVSPQLEVSRYYTPCNITDYGSAAYFKINEIEQREEVTLDLSKSIFTDPFSFYKIGETSMFGVKTVA